MRKRGRADSFTGQVVAYLKLLAKEVIVIPEGMILRLEMTGNPAYFDRETMSWRKPLRQGDWFYPPAIGSFFRTFADIKKYLSELSIDKEVSVYLREVPETDELDNELQDIIGCPIFLEFGLHLIKNCESPVPFWFGEPQPYIA